MHIRQLANGRGNVPSIVADIALARQKSRKSATSGLRDRSTTARLDLFNSFNLPKHNLHKHVQMTGERSEIRNVKKME